MKDIEKIKSEDLACQVADANPANFAIEQEVAQLVGATVPQPTEPSADDARELGAQLLVFLRRALLPIRSALRTALAAIYAHLDSRCTDYTPAAYAPYIPRPYDPMGTPPTPRTLPNLLTAITAFSARKISDLGDCPDGISFARLLCDSTAPITEIKDDLRDWVMNRSLPNLWANLNKVTLGCKEINPTTFTYSYNYLLPKTDVEYHILAKKITPKASGIGYIQSIVNGNQSKDVYCPELEEIGSGERFGFVGDGMTAASISLDKKYAIYAPKVRKCAGPIFNSYGENQYTCVYRVVLGTIEETFTPYQVYRTILFTPYLIDWQFGQGTRANLNLGYWNPSYVLSDNPTGNDLVTDEGISTNLDQFLQNFKEHIALRLTANGSGKTLTLSQAVRDAIHAAEATYGIEAIIVTQKGWTLSPAPGASSQ